MELRNKALNIYNINFNEALLTITEAILLQPKS